MFIMLVKLVIQLLVASKRHVELVCTAYYPSNPFFLHGFRSSYFLMLFMIHNIYLSFTGSIWGKFLLKREEQMPILLLMAGEFCVG